VSLADQSVAALLRSPFHRVLSGSTDLIRYRGRRSGQVITTPTQYARDGANVVILVAASDRKRWWRNFRPDEQPLEMLLEGRWVPMSARAVVGADEPEVATRLLDLYIARFPRAIRALGAGSPQEQVQSAVLVWCRPSAAEPAGAGPS
jgi:hypothetical protein